KAAALKAGEFPFWNPHLFGGAPFSADMVSQAFYPPSLLLLVGPLAVGFDVFLVFHLAWAAIGTYVLCRVRGDGWSGALVAAISFGLGGTVVSALTAVQFLCSYAWAPWVLAAATRWVSTRQLRWVGAGALAVSMQLLGGDPQAVIVTALLTLIL